MIAFCYKDILDDPAEAIVNPINCIGVMGKGLALQYRDAYPEMFTAYKQACAASEIKPGQLWVWPTGDKSGKGPRYIIGFPTKVSWRGSSKMEHITAGLSSLVEMCDDLNITSIAIPALGCGLGGLNWNPVKEAIQETFGSSGTVSASVYPPKDTA